MPPRDRPLFPPDRDIEDHVYCIVEFPAPGYDPKDKYASQKKIGVQYASLNGNGFEGYGEIVFGTEATLVLEKEQDLSVINGPGSRSGIKVSGGGSGPTLDTQASGAPVAVAKATGGPKVSRGYTEELEHWAWCIRNRSPENQPRCGPKTALGDAVIALTTNLAARQAKRIEFKKEWFDVNNDETPDGTFAHRTSEFQTVRNNIRSVVLDGTLRWVARPSLRSGTCHPFHDIHLTESNVRCISVLKKKQLVARTSTPPSATKSSAATC